MWEKQPAKAIANGEPTYENIGAPGRAAGWWQGHEAWNNLTAGGTMGVVYGAGSLWQWRQRRCRLSRCTQDLDGLGQPARPLLHVGRLNCPALHRCRASHGLGSVLRAVRLERQVRTLGCRPHHVDGKLYGVPYHALGMGFWYRKDIFEENGWTVPTTFAEQEDLVRP